MWVETVDGSDTLQTRWPCAAAAAGTNDLRKEFVSSVNQSVYGVRLISRSKATSKL